LIEGREQLEHVLQSNQALQSDGLSSIFTEFENVTRAYEETIERVEFLMKETEKIHENWKDWDETQRNLQCIMVGIVKELSELKKGENNSKQICSELEFCQERMNRLETVCNYLTSSLSILHDQSLPSSTVFDFASELTIYSNALIQLRTRCLFFEELVRKRRYVHNIPEIKSIRETEVVQKSIIDWPLKALLMLIGMLTVLITWMTSIDNGHVINNWRNAIGIHLEYVNGPPPF
uniref:KASH domain-containing protein n=1 Tax=Dracunculus medinensis TaxID=318479 RepID=A0A0N4UPW2_DRAME